MNKFLLTVFSLALAGPAAAQQAPTNASGLRYLSWPGKPPVGANVTATDSTGQTVAIPTQIEGIVDSADLTQSPPTLSIAGQDYTLAPLVSVSFDNVPAAVDYGQDTTVTVNVTGAPERVSACFVHGYRSMDVELERY